MATSPKDNPKLTDAQSGGTVDVLADLQDTVYMVQQTVYADTLRQQEQDFIWDLQAKKENMEDPHKDFHITPNDLKELKRIREKLLHG